MARAQYHWSEENLNVIKDNEDFLKKELNRVRRLRYNGPTGEPWPKRPKKSVRALDSTAKPHDILCGQRLHDYLVRNCVGAAFVYDTSRAPFATLESITERLLTQLCVAKQHGRNALSAYIDFGLTLQQAFALHSIEKDSGRRNDTWEKFVKERLHISVAEEKRCRQVAALVGSFPGFRKVNLTHTEIYNRRNQIRDLLTLNSPFADYWRQ